MKYCAFARRMPSKWHYTWTDYFTHNRIYRFERLKLDKSRNDDLR